MDALDNMFVPYRDVLAPQAPKTDRSKWIWIGLLVLVTGIALFLFSSMKHTAKDTWVPPAAELPTVAANPIVSAAATPASLATAVASASTAPASAPLAIAKLPVFQSIPQKIDLIRGGGAKAVKSETPQELARNVALAVKETLMTFPDMNAPTVAAIVECAIKTILKPQSQTQTMQVPVTAQMQQPTQPPRAPPPKPQGGIVDLRGKEIPFIDEEEITSSGAKQSKINADSDPNVLKRLRERGLDKRSA